MADPITTRQFQWQIKRYSCTGKTAGLSDSELKLGSSNEASRNNLAEFYKTAIPADSVARAIAFAIEQPADVGINEIVLRPLTQAF